MGIIFKIALRNLKTHKQKTLILGSIITLGMFIILTGNSVLDTVQKGIERNYTENFTGDIILSESPSRNLSLFSSFNQDSINNDNGALEEYQKIIAYLNTHKDVKSFSPQLAGQGQLNMEGFPNLPLQMIHVDSELYSQTFPGNIEIVEGSSINEEEGGILLSERMAMGIKKFSRGKIKLGDNITITASSDLGGTKIRDVKWAGVYRFTKDTSEEMRGLTFIDGTNLRAFTGMDQIVFDAKLTSSEESLLGDIDFDDALFGEEEETAELEAGTINTESLESLFEGFDASASRKADTDLYHFLLIKTEGSSDGLMEDLKKFLAGEEIDVHVHPWIDGAGSRARTVYTVKTVFNFIIFIIALVALIIIMNTLIISITERIGEIGTMRAIGAKKRVIRKMIFMETLVITLFFGLLGTALGSAFILIFQKIGLKASNSYLSLLFGGAVLHPELTSGSLLLSLVSLITAGVLSCLYPVYLANKISPIRAMNKGGL